MLTAVITISASATMTTSPIAYGQISTETVEAEKVALSSVSSIENVIREHFKDTPIMIDIARCESEFRQFDNSGTVLKNPTSSAKGVFQIMESIHQAPAARLGFDILTLEGNIAYAEYLLEKEGTKPWNSSANCWNKTLAYNE